MFERITSWTRKDGKGVEMKVSKKGDNYYSYFMIDGEVVLSMISPPMTYGTKTDVSTNATVGSTDISANVGVKYDKDVRYDKPIILFNSTNKFGLKIQDILPEVQKKIHEESPIQERFKIDPQSLTEPKIFDTSGGTKYVSNGSTIMEISNTGVILRPTAVLSPRAKETIELMLESMIGILFNRDNKFRANVMLYNPSKNTLIIVASHNMQGAIDENIEINVNNGGAGEAFRTNTLTIVDLVLKQHQDFGIEQNSVWRDMKSIISIPIHNRDGLVIGVLNIDSNMKYQQAEFDNEDKQSMLRMQTKIISNIIEYTASSN